MTINVPLLERTMETIEACEIEGNGWYQGQWRCDSGMCFAGWAVHLAGMRWLTVNPEDMFSEMVIVPADWAGVKHVTTHNRVCPPTDAIIVEDYIPEGIWVTTASRAAYHLLGETLVDDPDYNDRSIDLFAGSNGIETLRRGVKALVAEAQGG